MLKKVVQAVVVVLVLLISFTDFKVFATEINNEGNSFPSPHDKRFMSDCWLKDTMDTNLVSERNTKYLRSNSVSKSASSDSSTIEYNGTYGNVTWTIDNYGCLHIVGNGEFKDKNPSEDRANYAPWHRYADKIKTAVVELEGTTDFSQMFWECYNMERVVFANKKTLTPITMEGMFMSCYSLKSITWGPIDTGKVTSMYATFAECISLEKIDLSVFNTRELKQTPCMFWGCFNLSSVDFGDNFKTDKVVTMYRMFSFCYSLESLNLSSFDCSNLDALGATKIFDGCISLVEIKSPLRTGASEIELYVDEGQKGLKVWSEAGNSSEVISIPASQEKSITYYLVDRYDYWDSFNNSSSFFGKHGLVYYITDDDYNRLISNLSIKDAIFVCGSSVNNLYTNAISTNNKPYLRWNGSCYGMATWVALQNNNYSTLSSGLSGRQFDDDLMSKINYYHFQQYLWHNMLEVAGFMTNPNKVQILKYALDSGYVSLISYSYEGTDGLSSHTVCGLYLDDVSSGDTTDSGVDISMYDYCAVLYDPNETTISRRSDCNIYFNDNGDYYIPKKGIKENMLVFEKPKDGSDYILKDNIVCATIKESYINGVDYFTGRNSNPPISSSDWAFIKICMNQDYTIQWKGNQVSIQADGKMAGDTNDVYIVPFASELDGDETAKNAVVMLPLAEEYTIVTQKASDIYFSSELSSSYAGTSDRGVITFRINGDTRICNEDESKKVIMSGIDRRYNEDSGSWNGIYVLSDSGTILETTNIDNRRIVEGDNLTYTTVRLIDSYNEEVEPIILPQNTTRAEFSKDDEGNVIVEHNGDIIDDGKDEHQIKDGFRASFEITDNWEGGYNALIRIENTSEENIDNWTLAFDYDGEISNVWNAEILSHDGNRYTIKNAGWNQDIAPGQTIEIGLSGQENFVAEPTDYALISGINEGNTNDFSVSIQIYDDWGSGCNGNMTITNNSDTTIEDWVLEFDFDAELISIWNAEIVSHEGAHYIIKNAQHNSNIEPGQSVSVGFNGGEGAGSTELRGYKLYSYGS